MGGGMGVVLWGCWYGCGGMGVVWEWYGGGMEVVVLGKWYGGGFFTGGCFLGHSARAPMGKLELCMYVVELRAGHTPTYSTESYS